MCKNMETIHNASEMKNPNNKQAYKLVFFLITFKCIKTSMTIYVYMHTSNLHVDHATRNVATELLTSSNKNLHFMNSHAMYICCLLFIL